jgi:DNA-binding NarL/FixJ family response regulator
MQTIRDEVTDAFPRARGRLIARMSGSVGILSAEGGMEKLRVLIVDDHPIIGEALPVLMKPYEDIEIVGTAIDGEEGLAALRRLRPDCVVIDLNLPKLSGMEVIGLSLLEQPDLKVVIYTGQRDESVVCQALQAGVRAVVFKGAPVSTLVSALREARRGGYWLSTELTPSVIKRYLSQHGREVDKFTEYNTLSDREKQVFLLLAKGKSPHEIGEQLFISIKTVSKHQTMVKHKLKVKNAAEMAHYAMRIGLGETVE